MKENFHQRTEEQQAIIDIVTTVFPTSGYPKLILLVDELIVIASYLVYSGIGYKHTEYEVDFGRNSNRLCFYKKQDFQLLFSMDLKYAVNAIIKVDNRILIGTGVRGQPSGGELFEYNLNNNSLLSCTGDSNAISLLLDNGSHIDVVSFFQTGPYEGENRVYRLAKDKEFRIDYATDNYERLMDDEELEEIQSKEEYTITIERLQKIIQS